MTLDFALPSDQRTRTGRVVVRAAAMGMCFGVRDALAAAMAHPAPTEVTIHGELVHNEAILGRLRDRGFVMAPETARVRQASTAQVMITAHGVSDRERDALRDAGHELVDTTCPLVRRAHRAALELATAGYHVVVIGRPGHVEVKGLTGDLRTFDIVAEPRAVARYPYPRIGVVCQTTTPADVAGAIVAEIRTMNPDAEVRFVDTICEPTRQRQHAIEDLAAQVELVVVVGGTTSNNTRELVRRTTALGTPAIHVQGPADVDATQFRGVRVIGLTAGTSTPDDVIDAVEAALRALPSLPEVDAP